MFQTPEPVGERSDLGRDEGAVGAGGGDFRRYSAQQRRAAAVSRRLAEGGGRGRYFVPQCARQDEPLRGAPREPGPDPRRHCSTGSTAQSLRSITPRMMVLPARSASTPRSSLGWAASIEICVGDGAASCGRNE